MGVEQCSQHLGCKRVGAVGSRLRIDVIEVLETGRNHRGAYQNRTNQITYFMASTRVGISERSLALPLL